MTVALLGSCWAAAVLTAAWHHRPPPARVRRLLATAPGPARRTVGASRPWMGGPLTLLGTAVRRLARRPSDPVAARRLGAALAAAALVLPLAPPAAPAVGIAVWLRPVLAARRRRRHDDERLVRDLPDVVDLFVLAVGGGHTPALAVAAVGPRAPGRIGEELCRVTRDVGLGRRLADALDDVPDRLGDPIRPLVAALVASERYGAPLLDGLHRLADEVRHDRRRRAEEAARRVPVKLLFPLVLCTLPAFALLTVAPLLAGGLRSLRL